MEWAKPSHETNSNKASNKKNATAEIENQRNHQSKKPVHKAIILTLSGRALE